MKKENKAKHNKHFILSNDRKGQQAGIFSKRVIV